MEILDFNPQLYIIFSLELHPTPADVATERYCSAIPGCLLATDLPILNDVLMMVGNSACPSVVMLA